MSPEDSHRRRHDRLRRAPEPGKIDGKNRHVSKAVAAVAGVAVGAAFPLVMWALGVCSAPSAPEGVVGADGSPALSFSGAMALGFLLWAITWWIAGVLPDYVTALAMALLFVVACGVPAKDVFGAFAGTTWWLLFGAFGLGYAMQKCGLMKRMSLAILGVFPNTFKAQVAGFIAAGTLIGPFIPSLAAKASMLAPLSLSVSDSLGFERKGKQATGLFVAMFLGIRNVGPAVLSSSVIGYALLGTLPASVVEEFDMLRWLLCMLPWFAVVTALTYVTIILVFGDREEPGVKKPGAAGEEAAAPATEAFSQCASAIGCNGATLQVAKAERCPKASKKPMTRQERLMAVIVVVCILLWMTQPLHGLPPYVVAIAAFVATVACGIFDKEDLKTGINWPSLVFLGIVFGLADVFGVLGIDAWIVGICEPLMGAMAGNPYMLVVGVALVTVAVRFVIISEIPYLNISMAFMVPLAAGFGVNPWVVGVAAYAAVGPFFARYENPIYLVADSATGGVMESQARVSAYAVVYTGIVVTALVVSVPYWQLLGVL